MSYSYEDAGKERRHAINQAVAQRDSEKLFQLARQEAWEENEAFAESLRVIARRIDREDMAFDEHRDNEQSV